MTEEDFLWADTIWRSEADRSRWGFSETRVVCDDKGAHWIGDVHITSGDEGRAEVYGGIHPAESYEVTETKWRRQQ